MCKKFSTEVDRNSIFKANAFDNNLCSKYVRS